jgi:hypothetical protein
MKPIDLNSREGGEGGEESVIGMMKLHFAIVWYKHSETSCTAMYTSKHTLNIKWKSRTNVEMIYVNNKQKRRDE